MDYSYNYNIDSNRNYNSIINGPSLVKHCKPNIKKLKKNCTTIMVVMFVLAFVSFAILVPVAIPVIIIYAPRLEYYTALDRIVDEIKLQDKAKLDELSITSKIGIGMTLAVVKKLIETGNLTDYELIGEVAVAKKSLNLTENDFMIPGRKQTVAVARTTRCPSCGSSVTSTTGQFCAFCGTKIQ